MSISYEINKALTKNSKFKFQMDILILAIRRANIPVLFILNSGAKISGYIKTKYNQVLAIENQKNIYFVNLDSIEAIVIENDYDTFNIEDDDDDENEENVE